MPQEGEGAVRHSARIKVCIRVEHVQDHAAATAAGYEEHVYLATSLEEVVLGATCAACNRIPTLRAYTRQRLLSLPWKGSAAMGRRVGSRCTV